MEEKPRELNSNSSLFFINSIHFLHDSLSTLSYLSSHPLFSTIVALYTLILLLIPSLFLRIILSPIFNLTGFLLLSLLKLGVNERSRKESDSLESINLDSNNMHLKYSSPEIPECDQGEMSLYLGLGPKSKILDSVNQNHIWVSEPEPGLSPKPNSTRPRFLDSMDRNHKWGSEPNPEPEPEPRLGPKSNSTEPIFLDSVDQNHKWVFEPEPGLGPESNSMESINQEAEVIDSQDEYNKWESPISMEEDQNLESNSKQTGSGHGSGCTQFYEDSFLEWNMRAPLEVIYEEEEEDECHQNDSVSRLESYPSLSMYYPETDTDSSSDGEFPVIGKWDSPENMSFEWEEEKDELIEIALDRCGKKGIELYHVEEDNLIEIDICPGRN